MPSTWSVLRDPDSVEVAAEKFARPQTLLTSRMIPVLNRCLHAKEPKMANPRPTPKPETSSALATRHQRQPCRLFRGRRISDDRETDRGDGTRPRITTAIAMALGKKICSNAR